MSKQTKYDLNPGLLADFLASDEPITVERIRQLLSRSSDDEQTPDIAGGSAVDDFLEILLEVIE